MISSHILTELALVATRYGIISHGKLLQEISSDELAGVCRHTTEIKVTDRDALVALLAPDFDNTVMFLLDGGVRIEGDIDLNAVLGKIISAGLTIKDVNTYSTSIEDYYLSMMRGGDHA